MCIFRMDRKQKLCFGLAEPKKTADAKVSRVVSRTIGNPSAGLIELINCKILADNIWRKSCWWKNINNDVKYIIMLSMNSLYLLNR